MLGPDFFWKILHFLVNSRQLNDEKHLPPSNRDCSLPEVIHDLSGGVRPGGPDGEIDDWSLYEDSFRQIVEWSDAQGQFYENLQPVKEGGREHDLSHIEDGSEWLKFTKPSKAGYIVTFDSGSPSLAPALPAEYLARLQLQNELFADMIRFVGVGGTRREPRIITRQPHLEGESASSEAIEAMMVDYLHFRRLPQQFSVGYADSMAFVRDDIAVFDLRPANVVHTKDGFIAPIDAIPTLLDVHWQEKLLGASI